MNQPFINLLPPLSEIEFSALEADCKDGIRNPIIIDENANILDGHHRYKINPDVEFTVVEGLSFAEKQAFVYRSNNARRNLSPEQKAALRVAMRETALVLKTDGLTQAEIAGLLGVSREAVSKWLRGHIGKDTKVSLDSRITIPKSEYPEILEKIEAGKEQRQIAANYGVSPKTIGRITKAARVRRDVIDKLEGQESLEAKTIAGVYDVLVIDPPWPMVKIERDVAPEQTSFGYPTMELEEIKNLWLPMAEDCHVWLWTTQKHLPASFEILKEWGLNYVVNFVWHKSGGFQPFGLPQYNCEFALYARRGKPEFFDLSDFKTCFNAPRGKHSEKPSAFYNMVARVTKGRRLDMFNRREIPGFDGWGTETPEAETDEVWLV